MPQSSQRDGQTRSGAIFALTDGLRRILTRVVQGIMMLCPILLMQMKFLITS